MPHPIILASRGLLRDCKTSPINRFAALKVMVEVQWTNPGVARLTQSIKYITPFLLELPWIGVETEVCDFLDDGKGCQDNAQVRIKIMKIFFLVI